MDFSVLLLAIAIVIVGVMVFVMIVLTGHRTHNFDKTEYQTHFLTIENGLSRNNPATYPMSIISADKLLDKALMELGVPGKTMGDRLKRSGDKFTQLNSVWHAHKLRNAIAHEPGFELSYTQAANALATYKQALKDLGAI